MEELHPDLKDFIHTGASSGIVALKHPFIVTIYCPELNSHYNKLYVRRREEVELAKQHGKWSQFLALHERPYRLTAFQAVMDKMDDQSYWKLLGGIYTDSENIWQELQTWKSLLASDRSGKEFFMDEDERDYFNKLPETFDIYRGYIRDLNKKGLSYTLERKKAKWFAERFAVHFIQPPAVAKRRVKREQVFAVILRRNESEVILKPEYI